MYFYGGLGIRFDKTCVSEIPYLIMNQLNSFTFIKIIEPTTDTTIVKKNCLLLSSLIIHFAKARHIDYFLLIDLLNHITVTNQIKSQVIV